MAFVEINQQDVIRQAKLLQYANTKRNDGDFNDVTIRAGAESISANRMVLACYSKFFESMFRSQLRERYQNAVEINEFDGKAVKSVIEYIYTGKIDINQDNVITLLGVADFLQVDDVKQTCFGYLESILSIDNCLDIMKASVAYNNPSTLQQTYQYISESFDEIVQGDSFTDISKLDLTALLTNVNRNAVQETSLYTAIVDWVKHDETRKAEFSSLFLELDLQKLSLDFVLHTIANEELVRNNIDCLNAAFSYFTSSTKQAQEHDKLTKILCITGDKKNTLLEIYNSSQKSKSVYPNLPYDVSGHRALKLCDYVYCVYGYIECNKNETNKVYRLNLKTANSQWEEIASLNEQRYEFGAATWNGNLVVAGGVDGLSCLNSTELYEPRLNKWRTIASMNEGRRGHELAVANDKLFAIGGFEYYGPFSSVEQLDNVDGSWTFIKPMNVERRWFTALSVDNFIYAIGGLSTGKTQKPVEKYDVQKNEWSFVRNMNMDRQRHAACVLNGKIFVTGGINAKNEAVKQIECYDHTSDEWSIAGETEQIFYDHAVVVV